MQNTFKQDLLEGQKVELEVGNLLESKGWKVSFNNSSLIEDLRG